MPRQARVCHFRSQLAVVLDDRELKPAGLLSRADEDRNVTRSGRLEVTGGELRIADCSRNRSRLPKRRRSP